MMIDGKEKDIIDVLANGWFRVLEWSFIIGGIKILADTQNSKVLTFIYWISWALLSYYILRVIDRTDFNLFSGKSKIFRRNANIIISIALTMTLFLLLNQVINNVK